MKKFFSPVLVLFMMLSFVSFGCDTSKNDGDNNMVLLLLMDSMSGNCVTSKKDSGGTYYLSAGSHMPKGACSDTSTYYTDATAAVNAANAQLDVLIALSTNAGPDCSSVTTSINNMKTNQTAVNVQGLANANTPKCSALVAVTQGIVYCVDATEMTAFKANVKYTVLSDVRLDSALLPHYTAVVAAVHAAQLTNGFSDDAISNTKIFDAAYIGIAIKSYNGAAFNFANGSVQYNCAKIFLLDANLKAQVARYTGINANLGITATDASNVKSAIAYDYTTSPLSVGIFCCNGAGSGVSCSLTSHGDYSIPTCDASGQIPTSW
jgi:hypothetical protein